MDTVVRLSFSYCDIQLSNWRIDAGGLTLINNVQSHMERCAEVIQRASLSSLHEVNEHLGAGVTALAHGAQTVHSETANHGILEGHGCFLSLVKALQL